MRTNFVGSIAPTATNHATASPMLFPRILPGNQRSPPSIQSAVIGYFCSRKNTSFVYDRSSHATFLVDSGYVKSLLPKAVLNKKRSRQVLTHTVAKCEAHNVDIMLRLRRPEFLRRLMSDILCHYDLLVDSRDQTLIDASTSLTSNGLIALIPVRKPGRQIQRYPTEVH